MPDPTLSGWRHRLHEIVFEADTPSGKAFDVALLVAIVAVVMLESVVEIRDSYGPLLIAMEWFFTLLFTVEYIARLVSVGRSSASSESLIFSRSYRRT